jgi:hypothetical protein
MLACLPACLPAKQEQVATWQDERHVSKYADRLEQLPATRTIPMDPKQVWWVVA